MLYNLNIFICLLITRTLIAPPIGEILNFLPQNTPLFDKSQKNDRIRIDLFIARTPIQFLFILLSTVEM